MSELVSDILFIIIILVVTAILGILIGYFIGIIRSKKATRMMEDRIEALNEELKLSEISKNEVSVAANAQREILENQIGDLKTELLSCKKRADGLEAESENHRHGLENQVSQLEGELSCFKEEKTELEGKARNLAQALEEVKSEERQRDIAEEIAKKEEQEGNRTCNLKIIEGIGPKIEQILKQEGLDTWIRLSLADPDDIRSILISKGGSAYRIHDPRSWPEQAKLISEEKWHELRELQEKLNSGN